MTHPAEHQATPSRLPPPSISTSIAPLIIALDTDTVEEAERLVEQVEDEFDFFKIGWQSLAHPSCHALIAWLKARRKKIFLDAKLLDIPRTIEACCRQLATLEVDAISVHAQGESVAAARAGLGDSPCEIWAVTVLTSEEATPDTTRQAHARARAACEQGAHGIITSAQELPCMRRQLSHHVFKAVCPGIRDSATRGTDDQKRTATATESIRAGADYLVIGRAVTTARDPLLVARRVLKEIAAARDGI